MKKQIFLTLLCFCNILAYAQTFVPAGNVSGTWSLAGSPYNVQGDILVPNDSILTINPGVIVIFQGQYKLSVLGELLAIGNVSDTINFTAANTTIGWRGIRFENTTINNDTSRIKYCKIQFVKLPANNNIGGGIFCEDRGPIISNNSIINNSKGIFIDYGGSPTISYNVISNNNGDGIVCLGDSVTINNNQISNNQGDGILVESIYVDVMSAIISNNIISNNNENGIRNQISPTTINNNQIFNNQESGIYCFIGDTITIDNNQILNNHESGIYSGLTSPRIINNTFANNTALNGGGMSLVGGGPNGLINNNSFTGNKASAKGGGLYNMSACEISNNTFSYDTAANGGAIYTSNGKTKNNIVNYNFAYENGGGIYSFSGNIPVIDSNLITNNKVDASPDPYGGGGGGIFIYDGNPIVSNNVISNNVSTLGYGGGIACRISTSTQNSASIIDNKITYNSADSGGGISVYSVSTASYTNAKISRNSITNNTAMRGGGVYCYQGNPIIINSVISNNSAVLSGGGVSCDNSNTAIGGSTISNNTASIGGGIFLVNNSDAQIINNILWGNSQQIFFNDDTSDPNVLYSDIQGGLTSIGFSGNGYFAGDYQNNISVDPLFINPSQGTGINFDGLAANWALPSNSPCVDYGSSAQPSVNAGALYAFDIINNLRLMNCKIDLGAYEYKDSTTTSPIVFSSDAINFCPGDSVILTADEAFSYLWNTGDTSQSIIVSTSGNYNVTLTCNNGGTMPSNNTSVIVGGTPTTPVIYFNIATNNLANNVLGSFTYQWYLNSNIISGATSWNYTPVQNGSYTVIAISSIGCPSAMSAPYNFTSVGINESALNSNVEIIPNPNNGVFHLDVKGLQVLKVRIFNTMGKFICEIINLKSDIDLSALPKEMYFIEVITQEKTYYKKIITQ